MRRNTGNLINEQFCGNIQSGVVHNLDFEQKQCKINEIINKGHDIAFDFLWEASKRNFRKCEWCFENFKLKYKMDNN